MLLDMGNSQQSIMQIYKNVKTRHWLHRNNRKNDRIIEINELILLHQTKKNRKSRIQRRAKLNIRGRKRSISE